MSGFGDFSGVGGSLSSEESAQLEMQAFIEAENQKAAIQAAISKLTETCWDKCVGKPGARLSGGEQECISNCAERFIDTSQFVMQRMAKLSVDGSH
mmetsp:Transcript_16758/g.24125  ORF Transcript_16758/g.24125 Transcript_16758/m.24125 type:complete len:96 (+) Transcript_16758:182-469(+)